MRMTARDFEQALIERCVMAARNRHAVAHDRREANVFHVAASLIRGRFADEALNLTRASEHYFMQHPHDELAAADVMRNGWVIGLPRLRDRLTFELARQPNRPAPAT